MDTTPAVHPYHPRPYSHSHTHSIHNNSNSTSNQLQKKRLSAFPRSQSHNNIASPALGSLVLLSSSAPSTPTQVGLLISTPIALSTDNNIQPLSSFSSCTTPSSSSTSSPASAAAAATPAAIAVHSGPYPHPPRHPHLDPAHQTTSAQPPTQLVDQSLTATNSQQPFSSTLSHQQQQQQTPPIDQPSTTITTTLIPLASSSSSSSPSHCPSLLSEPDRQTRDTQESSKHIISPMPPATHIRQGSTGLGASQWEPYPPTTTRLAGGATTAAVTVGEDRRAPSLHHKSCYSFSSPFSPSALASLKLPPMSTPTLLPSSNATDPTAAELDLREVTGDTVSHLVKQALSSHGNKNAVLLLDMRPAVSHSELSIKTAVGVNVPNMLLKRPMYSLSMVTEHLTTDQEVETFSNWRRFSNIVLFDTTGATPVKGTPLFCIAQKFRKEGYSARIGYIQGGFNAFAHGHADLCSNNSNNSLPSANNSGTPPLSIDHARTSSNSSPDMSSAGPSKSNNTSPPRSRLHLGSLPSMITKPVVGDTVAQTPMIENPNVNPLFESVRQAMGLNTDITEEIPVRLPSGFSVDMIREHLPRWLLNAVDEPMAKSRLARYFQKVEIIEKKRLALLMCPQVMRSGKECDYSIGSGIEKGLKNRYNNVWPFDQTRIKIKELEQGGDDYINASLLTPPFGQRTYIATQAPLPTTFLDFWKVIWEQNSRVVVMLTREVEMGRVKCHKYWPTAQEPVLDLGPVRVTFVSEYQPHGHGANGSSSLSSSVLVRQMRLRHLLSPQEPERTITQLQYTGWPDFGVPDTPLEVLQLIELADKHNYIMPAGPSSSSSSSAGPMVVHCSAGCGRTGAFCVIDSVLSELKYRPESILCERSGHGNARQQLATGLDFRASLPNERVLEAMSKGGGGVGGSDMSQGVVIDEQQLMADVVFATVTKFREQRLSMVQCLRQYVFCYEAILWHLGKEFSKGRGGADFSVFATPKIQVPQTPAIAFPPHSRKPAGSSGFGLSMGNAPITTTNEEFSYFG